MYNTRHVVKYLCRSCSKTLAHLRPFHSVAEACEYHERVSSLDSSTSQDMSELSWLAYLSRSSELDLQKIVHSIPSPADKTAVLQILLTQPFHQRTWEELKEALSCLVREDPSNDAALLTALITQFSLGLVFILEL